MNFDRHAVAAPTRELAGWVAAERNGTWERADILDPSGSPASPIDARGITEKFRGINPQRPVGAIADMALAIEQHPVRRLLALLAQRTGSHGCHVA